MSLCFSESLFGVVAKQKSITAMLCKEEFMLVQFVVTGLTMSWLLGDQQLSPTTTKRDRSLFSMSLSDFSVTSNCAHDGTSRLVRICVMKGVTSCWVSPSSLSCSGIHISPAGIRKGYLISLIELWLIPLTSSLTASMEDKANGSVDVKRYCVMSIRYTAQLFHGGGC